MEKKKTFIIIAVALLVLSIGITFAYFIAKTGPGSSANANVTTGTVDDLKFNVSKENLSLNINQFNFASGSGNLSDNVTATASLKANSTKNTAKYNYYVYFQIESNDYVYTTTDKKPEIVLSITGPNGEITNVDGLTYVSATNADGTVVKGFDITESKPSVVKIANAYEISSSSSTNYTNQEWVFKVTFINLNENQTGNQGKTMSGKVLMQKDKLITNVSEVASSGDNLATTLETFGTKSVPSISNLYHHDGTIKDANGNVIDAADGSYRFAGTSADVKNYICLGSSEEACPDDNLYRIIGVFGENNHGVKDQQLVKVIKNTSYGLYKWNVTGINDWAKASLNTTLNSTFKTEKLSGFEDKIAEVSWKVSGSGVVNATAKTLYMAEITSSTKTVTSKIGLMYPSDYGYAITPDYWTTNLDSYNSAANQKDWLYLGTTEWTLTPSSYSSNFAWYLTSDGFVDNFTNVTISREARPSFYLNSDVNYVSGTGTSTDPIRIKL